jgi:D-glycero-D-manno-heptose 1,7-bisphosphate phosphatase
MKLLIVDHDGVISADTDGRTIHPQDWQALPGSPEALARLSLAGWHIVILVDRSALARGACDMAALNAVHTEMMATLGAAGAVVDLVLFAPTPDGGNRPARIAASLQDLLARLGAQPPQTVIVSDTYDELHAAHTLGCQPVLVLTGLGRATFDTADLPPDTLVRVDLAALAADLATSSVNS